MSYVAVFIITFAVVFIAFVGFEFWRRNRIRQRYESVRMPTDHASIKDFVSEIDEDIKRVNDATHLRFLQINKSTGLFYTGEWTTAITLLESIDPSAMPTEFKALYYNNLLASKLQLGEIDAANRLYARHLASLAQFIPNQDLNVAVGITTGALEYYNADIAKSRMILELVLGIMSPTPLHTAAGHHFLALIAASEGNHPKAIEHLNHAAVSGTGTWISESARNHLAAFEGSGEKAGVSH